MEQQDLFISYAHADRVSYIDPLTNAFDDHQITYWLDDENMRIGDRLTQRMNQGLAGCKYALLCLSANYLGRQWTESEMSASFALEKALPLILSDKEQVLKQYPLIAGLDYFDYGNGTNALLDALSKRLELGKKANDEIVVIIESRRTGDQTQLRANKRATVKWLLDQAIAAMGVRPEADVGAGLKIPMQWALVIGDAERVGKTEIQGVALVKVSKDGKTKTFQDGSARLSELRIKDGTVLQLIGEPKMLPGGGGGGGGEAGGGGGGGRIIPRIVTFYS